MKSEMLISFHKYQGTGNDFVMIDDRDQKFPFQNKALIASLCDRRLGIGGDGVILIQNHPALDFRMIYFNPDGSESLCGNGSRCAVAFARFLGMIDNETTFETTDGIHDAFFQEDEVHFHLHDVSQVDKLDSDWFIDTGSPHHIQFVDDIDDIDILREGKKIRYADRYSPNGTNVNFVGKANNSIRVRTYERGVEDETLSCGTGVTACAIAASFFNYESPIKVETKGGTLHVSFTKTTDNRFRDIYLAGPAKKVFEGTMEMVVSSNSILT